MGKAICYPSSHNFSEAPVRKAILFIFLKKKNQASSLTFYFSENQNQ